MLFFCLAILFLLALGIPQLTFMVRRQRLTKQDWSELVASIEPINLAGVAAIAEMYLKPTKDQLRLDPPVMWEMLGGLDGIHRLAANADAMLDLCVLAESWDYQGPIISELIRSDVAYLKQALLRIELATVRGHASVKSHFALMELAAYYNLIRLRLLGQYEKSHIARLPALQGRLGA